MRALIYSLIIVFSFSCTSVSRLQKKGKVTSESYLQSIPFTTQKSIILVPAIVSGESKNYLFDTGAQLSLIQREGTSKKTVTLTGATEKEMELSRDVLSSFQIGEVSFVNTVSLSGDFIGLKEQIPDFGGIIGQPIISKANWKIDYPNRTLEFSDKTLSDASYQSIKIDRVDMSPYVTLKIEGEDYRFLIDMGSSTPGIGIPEDHVLAEKLLKKYSFEETVAERYAIGGLQNVTEKVGIVPNVELGPMLFPDVQATIRETSQLRIGMNFFRNCIVIIDNDLGDYKIKRMN